MIFSVYHKPAPYVINDVFKVIKVGPNQEDFIPEGIGDNAGDNITDKNPVFAEMTAQYWVWKNVDLSDAPFIGFSHYRRHFDLDSKFAVHGRTTISSDKMSLFLRTEQEAKIQDYLRKYDAIVIKANVLRGTSIAKHYQTRHLARDWDQMIQIIKELYPDYFQTASKLFRKRWVDFYQCNMFILRIEEFRKYMSWIFSILFKIEKNIDLSLYENDQTRIIGFLAERLMTLYFKHNQLKLKERPVLFIES